MHPPGGKTRTPELCFGPLQPLVVLCWGSRVSKPRGGNRKHQTCPVHCMPAAKRFLGLVWQRRSSAVVISTPSLVRITACSKPISLTEVLMALHCKLSVLPVGSNHGGVVALCERAEAMLAERYAAVTLISRSLAGCSRDNANNCGSRHAAVCLVGQCVFSFSPAGFYAAVSGFSLIPKGLM